MKRGAVRGEGDAAGSPLRLPEPVGLGAIRGKLACCPLNYGGRSRTSRSNSSGWRWKDAHNRRRSSPGEKLLPGPVNASSLAATHASAAGAASGAWKQSIVTMAVVSRRQLYEVRPSGSPVAYLDLSADLAEGRSGIGSGRRFDRSSARRWGKGVREMAEQGQPGAGVVARRSQLAQTAGRKWTQRHLR